MRNGWLAAALLLGFILGFAFEQWWLTSHSDEEDDGPTVVEMRTS